MINSAGNRAASHELSDLLLQPPLEEIDMLNWRLRPAIEIGYRHAQHRLEEWQKLRVGRIDQ